MIYSLKNSLIRFFVLSVGAAALTLMLVKAASVLAPIPVCRGMNDLNEGGRWMRGKTIPQARVEPAVAMLDSRIYVVGGMMAGWLASNQVQVYDPLSGQWESAAPLPILVHHAGLAAIEGDLYMTGGYDDMGQMMRAEPRINQAWRYDPEADVWTRIADMPAPRAAHASIAINGLLYIVGGTGTAAREVWVYNPATDTWDTSQRALMPMAREHIAAVALDGQIYVVGGRWNNINTGATEKYDPASDTWTKLADMPTPRSTLSLAVLNGYIHAAGGEDMISGCTYAVHEVYDPDSDTWTKLADMPTPRQAMGAAVVDGRWYLISGSTGSARYAERGLTSLVEVFIPGEWG